MKKVMIPNTPIADVAPETETQPAPSPTFEELKAESDQREARKAALSEASKLLFTDVRNAAEMTSQFCIFENAKHIRYHYQQLLERLQKAHVILHALVPDLPTINLVTYHNDAPTAEAAPETKPTT